MLLLGLSIATWAIILVTLLFAILWVQVLILHYRGAFRRIWMWEPVVYLPILVVMGIVAIFVHGVFLEVYGIALTLSMLMGLSGFVFHIQGILNEVDGWNLDNIMVGPPPMFPLSVALISMIGVVAALLGR
ncbi:MAG: hypothetical protein ACYC56_02595 [Candidatus Aquicultor sp.]